jgi:hypothetical protein
VHADGIAALWQKKFFLFGARLLLFSLEGEEIFFNSIFGIPNSGRTLVLFRALLPVPDKLCRAYIRIF